MKTTTGELRSKSAHVPYYQRLDQLLLQSVSLAKRSGPFLLPLLLLGGKSAFASGGTIDLTGFSSMFQSLQAPALLIGSVLTLISLIFSVFGFMGGNVIRGVTGAFGVIIGAVIIGLGAGWISSLTGQTVGQ